MRMKLRNLLSGFATFFAITSLGVGHVHAENGYKKYRNQQFNYSIIVPASWSLYDLNLNDKHIMLAEKNQSTEIKVRAYRSSETDFDKMVSKNNWRLRKIDPLLNKIIETEKITIRRKTSKLLVFEYSSKRTKILQRTMITKSDDTIYIIECKSPISSFYRFEDTFNIALSSFDVLQRREQENKQQEPANITPSEPSRIIQKKDKSEEIPEEKFFELE